MPKKCVTPFQSRNLSWVLIMNDFKNQYKGILIAAYHLYDNSTLTFLYEIIGFETCLSLSLEMVY